MNHYGFSDTTEIFMFVSGVTCALAYGKIQREHGWWVAVSHTLRRSWEIYVAFLILIIAIVAAVYVNGNDAFADMTNVRVLLERPGAALAQAAILQYRPVNTDVLPTFILFHLFFAPLLWLLVRMPDLALAASFLLYALVQLFGWGLQRWPADDWYFNPFAWQLLVVLGAWWVSSGGSRLQRVVTSRLVVSLAVLYLLFALLVVLGWSIEAVEGLVPASIARLIYPVNKPDLDPLRLLHFLALAVLAARFVPHDWGKSAHPLLLAAVRCGENSLAVYCLSVLLSLGSQMLLTQAYGGIAAQIALSVAGILALVAFATWSSRIELVSRQHPKLF
jgi:hypothetical protein